MEAPPKHIVCTAELDNLGIRHRALNTRVNEAAAKKVDFESARNEPESNKVDRLYKIDLAAKYKNVDFILETFKSGESLYISRALNKARWLFDDEYSHIINPTYLESNIFSSTSSKMKRKILNTAAACVRNPTRAAEFYHYCAQQNIRHTALTWFLYTADDFKVQQLRDNKEKALKELHTKDLTYLRFFVGKSLIVLEALLEFVPTHLKAEEIARKFKNLFYVSEEKYLDITEKYIHIQDGFQNQRFDPKLSDRIMKKHKRRVVEKPLFYANIVDTEVLVRNSTVDEIKLYIAALLPDTTDQFWAHNHYIILKSLFQKLPHEEIYPFLKKYFNDQYTGAEFENHTDFFKYQYHYFLTQEQRKEWALNQLNSKKETSDVGSMYPYYRYVNFDAALEGIKQFLSIARNAEERYEMLQALIESAHNNREVEDLCTFYRQNHVDELKQNKERLFENVLLYHNVFEFDDGTWKAFYTLMDALGHFNATDDQGSSTDKLRDVVVLYYITNQTEIPKLKQYLLDHFKVENIANHLKHINEKKKQMLHEFFFNLYVGEIEKAKNNTYKLYTHFKDEVEPRLWRYFINIDSSMKLFNVNGECNGKKDEYATLPQGRRNKLFKQRNPSYDQFAVSYLRDLKKDKELVMKRLAKGPYYLGYKSNAFLKKIAIYFPDINDLTVRNYPVPPPSPESEKPYDPFHCTILPFATE